MTKAFGYLRVSGKDQIEGDGFPRQRAAITKYAAANDLRIVRWFEERGESGKLEWEARPAWSQMMQALNGAQTVIIERLDRLARDLMVQEHIIADLKRRRISLISTEEPDLGSDEPARVLMRQIMGAIAQYDRAMITIKLAGARRRMKAATGRCEGQKPFGHRPGEARALALMTEYRATGQSYDDIAKTLNFQEMPTRRGGPWIGATVAKILRRAAFASS